MAVPIDLKGRIILVCGVSRGGIGGATARRIAGAGATVVAVDYAQAILDETLADIAAAGGSAHGIVTDLMEEAQTDGLIPTVLERFGRLDGVANVAGGTRADEWMPLEDTPIESFRKTLNLNLEYVFRVCRDAAGAMIKAGTPGSLVNVSSVSSLAGAPFHGPYGAAKSGISALTRTMALEWAPYGIRANAVLPGAVFTERVRSRQIDPTSTEPGMRWTSVDELANMILFLLSDLASGVSGQAIAVDNAISTRFCAATPGMLTGLGAKRPGPPS
jgi:NAD(P)-dependent dehydrogenase (short-subunit alcohol dehydrogenase family)